MLEPQRLTTLWAFMACTGIALPYLFIHKHYNYAYYVTSHLNSSVLHPHSFPPSFLSVFSPSFLQLLFIPASYCYSDSFFCMNIRKLLAPKSHSTVFIPWCLAMWFKSSSLLYMGQIPLILPHHIIHLLASPAHLSICILVDEVDGMQVLWRRVATELVEAAVGMSGPPPPPHGLSTGLSPGSRRASLESGCCLSVSIFAGCFLPIRSVSCGLSSKSSALPAATLPLVQCSASLSCRLLHHDKVGFK
jgi:hypothetical protein